MAELPQDAGLALTVVPEPGLALLLVLLAHPASPALAASTAIAAIAAPVICLIKALLVRTRKVKVTSIIPNGPGSCPSDPDWCWPAERRCASRPTRIQVRAIGAAGLPFSSLPR